MSRAWPLAPSDTAMRGDPATPSEQCAPSIGLGLTRNLLEVLLDDGGAERDVKFAPGDHGAEAYGVAWRGKLRQINRSQRIAGELPPSRGGTDLELGSFSA